MNAGRDETAPLFWGLTNPPNPVILTIVTLSNPRPPERFWWAFFV